MKYPILITLFILGLGQALLAQDTTKSLIDIINMINFVLQPMLRPLNLYKTNAL